MSRLKTSPGLRWRGLPLQLFGITVLPLTVLLLVITFGSLALHQNSMRDLVGERDERATRSAANAISEQLYHRSTAVRNLALRAADGTAPTAILDTSGFLLPDFDGGLAFFSPDGVRLAVTKGDTASSQLLTDSAVSPLLKDVLSRAGPEPVFSSPFTDPHTHQPFVLAAASVQGGPIAVGAFSPASLARRALADAFTSGDQTSVFMVDAQRQVLYQAGSLAIGAHVTEHHGVAEALRGESGTTYVQADGDEHVVAYSTVAPIGWALVIEERWAAVTSPMLRVTQLAPLVLVPALLLTLLALWFGARQIVQPLQSLEAKASDLAWGRYEAIEQPVDGIAEIRRLQAELIHMAHKVKAAQESLRSYIGAITAGQEEERRRLARELHDDTLQSLIALNQRIQLAQLSLADSPTAGSLSEIQNLTEQTIADLRRFTRALRPIYLEDLGLVAASEMLTREVSQASNLRVEFHRVGTERRLVPEVELALYRMAQEALSNVARHAQALHAILTISFTPTDITLTVSDDGHGFTVPESPAEFAPSAHFGLLGLHERSELIGAHLDIQSSPGQGTRVVVQLPTSKPSA
jgi:signal transduction histidine kinase